MYSKEAFEAMTVVELRKVARENVVIICHGNAAAVFFNGRLCALRNVVVAGIAPDTYNARVIADGQIVAGVDPLIVTSALGG